MQDNKQKILQESDGGIKFFFHVLGELDMVSDNRCENTLNPFYDDTKPSLSVYLIENDDRWRFKDYGDESYSGDVFDFAALHYELDVKKDFHLILTKMAKDLNISLPASQFSHETYTRQFWDYFKGPRWAWRGFELQYSSGNQGINKANDYFKQYGITEEVLKRYNVRAIDSYKIYDWDNGKSVYRGMNKNDLFIAYTDVYFTKIYSPSPKKFWYIGKKDSDYVFGMRQVFNKSVRTRQSIPLLIITGGEKDVLTLASLGYDAISLNSETSSFPKILTENWLNIADKIVFLYDSDETGKRKSEEGCKYLRSKGFNADVITLPEELTKSGGKDISDYIKLGLPIQKLRALLSNDSMAKEEEHEGTIKLPTTISNGDSFMTPTIPTEVYKSLPDFLNKLLHHFNDPRDKDVALLSALGVLSTLMPKVKGVYDGKKIAANFYLFISAPAASGKGVMVWSRKLGSKIQESINTQFLKDYASYLEKNQHYKENVGNNPDLVKPVEPKRKVLFIPANTSGSKMIEHIDANKDFGVIFASEADALTTAMKNEWGNFSEVMRGAFHHEPIELSRRGNNEFLSNEKAHLSVVLSGTPKQVNSLVESVENGFFSRFAFYEFEAPIIWRDLFGDGSNSLEQEYENAADYLNDFWLKNSSGKEAFVHFTKEQRDIVFEIFSDKLSTLYHRYGENIRASVNRLCVIIYRIAMILTVLRYWEQDKNLPSKILVKNEEFVNAMDIGNVMFDHLEHVFRRFTENGYGTKLSGLQKVLFNALPTEFTTGDLNRISKELKINHNTKRKYLTDFQKLELLEKVQHANYRKLNV